MAQWSQRVVLPGQIRVLTMLERRKHRRLQAHNAPDNPLHVRFNSGAHN